MGSDAMTNDRPGPERPGLFALLASWWGEHAAAQLALLAGTALLFGLLGGNMVENMHRFGITPGFDFLDRPANFEIGESLIAYSARDSYGHAILVGLLNTVKVAVAGCVLATVLGVALGVARLSGNPLLSGIVQAYVELIRNTPLLLQLFFWSATLHALPPPRQALHPFAGVYLCNRGILMPALADGTDVGWLAAALAASAALVAGFLRAMRRLGRRRGRPMAGGACLAARLVVAALALALPAVALLAGPPLAVEVPELRGFNFVGGATLSPEFAALLVGLVVNASAGVSEIVRSGIQSVSAGQWEAARALGLPWGRTMRLVILPQALRVIVPLMTSTYLSLTKNSSLAVAIGFPDLVSVVNTSANQTGQALEAMAILMVTYLALSLAVSVAMNAYNRRMALRGMSR